MAYEFKRLSDVAAVEAVTENTNVLIEEGGIVKKVNKSYVGEKVSDATLVETTTEGAHVIIEENGIVKRVHKSQIGLTEVSWNDLKDKPFHEEGEMSEILPEMSFEFYDDQPVMPNVPLTFEEGADYIVIFDGQEYRCTSYIAEGPMTPSIGNGVIGGAGERHNNEPFFVTVYGGNVMIFAAEPGSYTMSILKAPKIKTIDYKWMPKGYPTIKTAMVEIIPEQTFAQEYSYELDGITYYGGNYQTENILINTEHLEKPYCTLKPGTQYIIVINGEKHESTCIMIPDSDGPSIGNEERAAIILTHISSVLVEWNASYGDTVTVAVYGVGEVVTPMDPRFMSGGALTVIFDDRTAASGDDSAITCNVSVEEITQAVYAGRPIVSYLVLDDYYNVRQLLLKNGDPNIGFYTFVTPIEIYDGTYSYLSYHIERDGTIEYSYESQSLSGDS